MTSTDTHATEVTPTFTESLLTHIALPVRDLEATLAFYEKYTKLVNIHERQDPETGLRTTRGAVASSSMIPRAPPSVPYVGTVPKKVRFPAVAQARGRSCWAVAPRAAICTGF